MRRVLTAFLLLGLAAPAARAQDKSGTPPSPAFKALQDEYAAARQKAAAEQKKNAEVVMKEFQAAKTEAEKKAAQAKMIVLMRNNADAAFGPRFVAFAEKNPRDPSAFDALVMALRISTGPQDKNWTRILDRLRTGYAAKPEIKQIVRMAGSISDPAIDQLLNEVMAKNPDRKLQALTCKTLISGRETSVKLAEQLKKDPAMQANAEAQVGKDYVQRLLATADKARDEAAALKKQLREKYADVYPDLSVGKVAPEVVSQDLSGKEARLSALKGKVVVLDIWATWCGPCKAMIPHEREMVEKLKGKPFALVSISADAKKETLTDFLKTEKMPWTHWWNGAEGGLLEAWDVQFYPTIYVLDARGVIRYHNVRGEELEQAVNTLLKEMGAK